jgi:UDP-glucose 4-epimerase
MASIADARVLVTGGAGFIGSHLVDALLAGGARHVTIVDNFFLGKDTNLAPARLRFAEKLSLYREDAGDFAAMRAICDAERPELVFNLATKALRYSFFNPAGAAKVNVDIALTLAELLRAGAFGRLIQISTSEVYGTARLVPMSEHHPLLAETSYAAGKAAADLMLASYVNMFNLDIFTIRPFNNYGPRQNDGDLAAVIPLTIRRLARGEAPVIEGDGLQTRDFIFVADTVKAILRLATLDGLSGKVLNLGSGKETSILEIAEALCELMSNRRSISYVPARPADVRRHCADITAVRAQIGEMALTPLAEGLKRTVEWYRESRP